VTTDLISPSDFITVLAAAASSSRPSSEALVKALLTAEKTAKQQRLSYQFPSLIGKWRLCFATGTRKVRQRGGIILGKGFYLPKFVPAQISFETSPLGIEIGNSVQIGAILLQLTGPAKYLDKKNLLAFDFTNLRLSLLGRTLYSGKIRSGKTQVDFENQPIAKLAFFSFFFVTENLIAARGRGGGLALWVRE